MATSPTGETPTVRCPVRTCAHPINNHSADGTCTAAAFSGCNCRLDPNTIAVALLFGELTPSPATPPRTISRQADGSWS